MDAFFVVCATDRDEVAMLESDEAEVSPAEDCASVEPGWTTGWEGSLYAVDSPDAPADWLVGGDTAPDGAGSDEAVDGFCCTG